MRKILRPEEYTALEQERCNPSLDTALKTAYREAGFREEVHGESIAGIDEDRLHTLLYVPATNAGEADSKVQEYRRKINDLLQPRRLSCDYKIKPVMKKD